MSKRGIIVLLGAVVVGLVLVVTVPPLLDSPPQIAEKGPGTWHEIGETPGYTMHVSHAAGTLYAVTYPRWDYAPEGFQLQGDELRGGVTHVHRVAGRLADLVPGPGAFLGDLRRRVQERRDGHN